MTTQKTWALTAFFAIPFTIPDNSHPLCSQATTAILSIRETTKRAKARGDSQIRQPSHLSFHTFAHIAHPNINHQLRFLE